MKRYGWLGFVDENLRFADTLLTNTGGSHRKYADKINEYKLENVNPEITHEEVREAIKQAYGVTSDWYTNKLDRCNQVNATTYVFVIRRPYTD